MNVAISSRHAVHAGSTDSNVPACHGFGAPHGSEAYRKTTRPVTCKKCLKIQDAEAATETPATEVATEVATETAEVTETPATEVATEVATETAEAATETPATEVATETAEAATETPATATVDLAIVITVDMVTPTKGLILSGGLAGTVLHTEKREQTPGAGWDAENEYGEHVAHGATSLEAAVCLWAMSEGLTGRLVLIVDREYERTGQRDA